MAHNAADLYVNPADETIHLGPLTVRFLLTGENSTGTIAAFGGCCSGRSTTGSSSTQPQPLRGDDLRCRWSIDLDR